MDITGNTPYIAEGISTFALESFLKKCKEDNVGLHAFELYENNELKVRFAPHPYSCGEKAHVFSLSKSFASTAIGFAAQEGLLHVKDKVVDIFADKLPEKVSENLKKMEIHHLLSMNTGHAECVMHYMSYGDDGVKEFLSREVAFEPGTHFTYNTGASCMLAAIIERVTGLSLYDYLNIKFFIPLGIKAYWDSLKDGTDEGGCGLHISCDDIVKLGIFYLNKGVWEGKRLLSEEWVAQASFPHSDNKDNGSKDWTAGYGYQFWMNAESGYRGDGAHGQLCLVLPEKNMVVAAYAYIDNMQHEMDLVFDLIKNLHGKTEKENGIKDILDHFYTPLNAADIDTRKYLNKIFKCEKNLMEMTSFSFGREGERLVLNYSNGHREQKIIYGNGAFVENRLWAKGLKPTLWFLLRDDRFEETFFAGSYTVSENEIRLQHRFLDVAYTETITFKFEDDNVTVHFDGLRNPDCAYVKATVI